jgi:hypothetical protein
VGLFCVFGFPSAEVKMDLIYFHIQGWGSSIINDSVRPFFRVAPETVMRYPKSCFPVVTFTAELTLLNRFHGYEYSTLLLLGEHLLVVAGLAGKTALQMLVSMKNRLIRCLIALIDEILH